MGGQKDLHKCLILEYVVGNVNAKRIFHQGEAHGRGGVLTPLYLVRLKSGVLELLVNDTFEVLDIRIDETLLGVKPNSAA